MHTCKPHGKQRMRNTLPNDYGLYKCMLGDRMSKICVIVPIYCVEVYLERCINSILNQKFKDYVIVLVDDGSPDSCGKICDEYATKCDRIHVIHQKNKGLSSARNTGIEWALLYSKCQWISFIDSDDWIHPCFLEYLLNAAESNNTNIATCNFIRTSGEDISYVSDLACKVLDIEDYYIHHIVNATSVCWKLFKMDCFQSIRFPESRVFEDEFTTYKILFCESKITYIEQPLYAYFANPKSITGSPWNQKNYDDLDAWEEQLDFFLNSKRLAVAENVYNILIIRCCSHIQKIEESESLSLSEKNMYRDVIRKRLRYLLSDYRDYKWFSVLHPHTNLWIYANAHPYLLLLFRVWKPVKRFAKKRDIWHDRGYAASRLI